MCGYINNRGVSLVNRWPLASIFVQVGQNVSDCSFLIFHTVCEQSTSEIDVDQGTLAAAYRLGFSIFWNEHK